jgi:hypothetical protein
VQIVCDGTSIQVLTPQVRPQPDGVHIRMDNRSDRELTVGLRYANGGGGGNGAPPGVFEVADPQGGTALPAPPGVTTVTCTDLSLHGNPDDAPPTATFEIVDEDGIYISTALDCDEQVSGIGDYVAGTTGEVGDPVDLARAHFQRLRDTDIVERAGYPESTIPVVRVVRDGQAIATIEYEPDGQGGWLTGTVSRCTDADIRG